MTNQKQKRGDVFAQIAATEAALREASLIEPQPAVLPDVELPSNRSMPGAAFRPAPAVDTPEKLSQALDKERRRMARYMQDLAPEIEPTRIRKRIASFDWRRETVADQQQFSRVLNGRGDWSRVSIPHYGGPLGRAVTYYRTTFKVSKRMLARGAVFVCFKGVDYKAHVFVNGSYLGSHEGFFAPFEFDATSVVQAGANTLVVKVENDAICMSNQSWIEGGGSLEGDKIYAATGPGYDEPVTGWHHCPPGMGIYQDVTVEARSRVHVADLFCRLMPTVDANGDAYGERERGAVDRDPLASPPASTEERSSQNRHLSCEALIEVFNCGVEREDITLEISVYGRNFRKTLFRDRQYEVASAGPTFNYYKLSFDIPNARRWSPDTPWLYQIHVKVLNAKGKNLDTLSRQFGLRSFHMDEERTPKGRMFLNGDEIRLRGANTMGHMQQCVMKKDWDQLRDDILLARLCHMNFFRLTQRPVQPEIYAFCDQLGMMTQTDLPLFGVLRRNQFVEAARQAGEMERLVRNHPCNIMVSYINEPFPNGRDEPHRQLQRHELESFFTAANQSVHLNNPDRVIKPVDGDYDPPGPGLPDNHCYCCWYNGHGVNIGKLNKGYWQKVNPDWLYGCGEFGAEGLDPVAVMRRYYPKAWLPHTTQEEACWTPDRIPKAQTGRFHFKWFDTQHSLADWARASQAHQAWATRMMTQAFRRDSRMNSFAIHLFIDAFPSGWMKAIMDVERTPKTAYFAYRDALTPLMVHWRTDRFAYVAGEPLELEAWICNDCNDAPAGAWLHYQLEMDGQTIFSRRVKAEIPVQSSRCAGVLRRAAPAVEGRKTVTARVGLLTADGKVLHDSALDVEVFAGGRVNIQHPTSNIKHSTNNIAVVGARNGKAGQLVAELDLQHSFTHTRAPLFVIDDMEQYEKRRAEIDEAVKQGALAVFLELSAGDSSVAGWKVKVEICGVGARHFVSRSTGHPLVSDFKPDDFFFWYDPAVGYVTPLLERVFAADGFVPILTSGNGEWKGIWKPALVAGEKCYGQGRVRICQLALADRVTHNPVARQFARRLLCD